MGYRRSQLGRAPDLLDYALLGVGGRRDAATADAFRRAGTLLGAGRHEHTLAMLEYAQRLSPSDGGITLAIGLLRLTLGDAAAIAAFETLAARSAWRDIGMALVRARMKFDDVTRAAQALHSALAVNGPPTGPAYVALASSVSEGVGAQGWCALGNDGCVTIGSQRNLSVGLSILLDGVRVDAAPHPAHGLHAVSLPSGWEGARRVDVLLRGQALIGSPIDVAAVTRVEGFVEFVPESGSLRGWCWFPAERERTPTLTLAALADPTRRIVFPAQTIDPSLNRGDEFGLPHCFAVDAARLAQLGGSGVTVIGPHGQPLYGSPLWPGAESRAASHHYLPALPSSLRGIDIIIPVYGGYDMTLACIESVRAQLADSERIVVVSDASPDADLLAALSGMARRGEIVLLADTVRRGFPGAANLGLRLAAGCDVVLLNSDTVVAPGWLGGLRAAAHRAPDIGTATPLSNDATIFSYPRREGGNPYPDVAAMAALAAAANGGVIIDVPTGHGFCLYIRAECLEQTGLLREDLFAQGYGEENDFCVRATRLGWRHVAAPGAFVAHHGARSFGTARDDLMRRNLDILNRLHPGYDDTIAAWQRRDPLGPSRRRIDRARLERARAGRQAVLLVCHDRAGGVRHHVTRRAAAIARAGFLPLLLWPDNATDADGRIAAHEVRLDIGPDYAHPNLRFHLPDEQAALQACLEDCAIAAIELHSLVGHHDGMADLLTAQGVPFDVVIHDYSWFCARITLTTGDHRYCGEPGLAACRACVAASGAAFDGGASPDRLAARSQRLIGAARAVIAPSQDAARRIRNHFGVAVSVRPWETPVEAPVTPPARTVRAMAGRTVRVCVVGAIGPEKGYRSLLDCARLAASGGLPLEFVVVGHTSDDAALLDTGVVRITGRHDHAEAVALIAKQDADFAWLPSVWPETWSYVLTQIWQAGLPVIVHDIGAPAERVRAGGDGLIVPLHLPPDRLVGLFLHPALFRAGHDPRPARAAAG